MTLILISHLPSSSCFFLYLVLPLVICCPFSISLNYRISCYNPTIRYSLYPCSICSEAPLLLWSSGTSFFISKINSSSLIFCCTTHTKSKPDIYHVLAYLPSYHACLTLLRYKQAFIVNASLEKASAHLNAFLYSKGEINFTVFTRVSTCSYHHISISRAYRHQGATTIS